TPSGARSSVWYSVPGGIPAGMNGPWNGGSAGPRGPYGLGGKPWVMGAARPRRAARDEAHPGRAPPQAPKDPVPCAASVPFGGARGLGDARPTRRSGARGRRVYDAAWPDPRILAGDHG